MAANTTTPSYKVRGFKSPSEIIANENQFLLQMEQKYFKPKEVEVQIDTALEATDPAAQAVERNFSDDELQQKLFIKNMIWMMSNEREAIYLAQMLPLDTIKYINKNITDVGQKLGSYRKAQLTSSFMREWIHDYMNKPKTFSFL